MTVARILSEKGASVATVGPEKTLGDVIHILAEKTLGDVIHILAEKRIGALVVAHPDGTVAGIVSERDIMRALARLGAATLDAPVGDHMTANVTTCNRSTTIEDVMELMTNGRFRHIPVCEGERLVGIVSIGDVVARRIATVEAEHQALREYITTA